MERNTDGFFPDFHGQLKCGCAFKMGECICLCPNHNLDYWKEVGKRIMGENSTECPVCLVKRLHTEVELDRWHPLSREGFTKEQGWTSLAAKEVHEEDERRLNEQKQ